jgi:hypothetical protein
MAKDGPQKKRNPVQLIKRNFCEKLVPNLPDLKEFFLKNLCQI